MKKYFLIGSFACSIEYPEELTLPENLKIFEHSIQNKYSIQKDYSIQDTESSQLPASVGNKDSDSDRCLYAYKLVLNPAFPEPMGQLVAKKEDLLVFDNHGLESRYIGVKNSKDYYACYKEIDEQSAIVYIDPKVLDFLHFDPAFISLLALEKRLLQYDSLVLHCAYIEVDGRGVLFSAPSETGKTTQANLWHTYRGSRTINGDRALLMKKEDVWTASGWPVCGTSEICLNETLPIHCIVMLSQAKINSVEKLFGMKAFSKVYSQITINRWNQEALNQSMNLIEDLISLVPVYHLACDISEDAVKCLEENIF